MGTALGGGGDRFGGTHGAFWLPGAFSSRRISSLPWRTQRTSSRSPDQFTRCPQPPACSPSARWDPSWATVPVNPPPAYGPSPGRGSSQRAAGDPRLGEQPPRMSWTMTSSLPPAWSWRVLSCRRGPALPGHPPGDGRSPHGYTRGGRAPRNGQPPRSCGWERSWCPPVPGGWRTGRTPCPPPRQLPLPSWCCGPVRPVRAPPSPPPVWETHGARGALSPLLGVQPGGLSKRPHASQERAALPRGCECPRPPWRRLPGRAAPHPGCPPPTRRP